MDLRKRLPLYCLHKDVNGKPDHLDHALTETEGDQCQAHELAEKQAKEKFFNAPVQNLTEPSLPQPKPHWPFWPGAN